MSSWIRRSRALLARTNRYTDGSGRALESNELPKDLYLPPMSHRAYPRQTESWQPTTRIPRSSVTNAIVQSSSESSEVVSASDARTSVSTKGERKESMVQNISHAEAVMITKPTPHKGNVIISGGGVVGLVTAALWGVRGWHTTVLERSLPVSSLCSSLEYSPSLTTPTGCLRRPRFPAEEEGKIRGESASCHLSSHTSSTSVSHSFPPFLELQYALINRRAADILGQAGIPNSVLRECGVPVTGIMEHPGAYHSWISRGLTEYHPFAAKLLAVDMWELRKTLEEHILRDLRTDNVCVFYEREIEVVYPLRQEVVIRHRGTQEASMNSRVSTKGGPLHAAVKNNPNDFSGGTREENEFHSSCKSALEKGPFSSLLDTQNSKKLVTSLSLSPMRWEKKYAKDAVSYDLLLSAEGTNSTLRDLLDVEGFSTDEDFGSRWFLLRIDRRNHRREATFSSVTREEEGADSARAENVMNDDDSAPSLSPTCIHRWLHACPSSLRCVTPGIPTCSSVPLVLAFPRIENNHASKTERFYYFSVMAYMPRKMLEGMTDEDIYRLYLPDVWKRETEYQHCVALHKSEVETVPKPLPSYASFVSFSSSLVPAPTVFCEHLFNSVGLPNAVLLGDAAHFCNPFWLQQLPMALEDSLYLLQHVDSCSRHVYDAIKQFSDERGVSGDALREITEKCLYYQRRKHRNPILRFRNTYHRWMYRLMPVKENTMYEGSTNHLYARSIEEMFNGRGYASYEFAEKQQSKHRMFYHFSRLYT